MIYLYFGIAGFFFLGVGLALGVFIGIGIEASKRADAAEYPEEPEGTEHL